MENIRDLLQKAPYNLKIIEFEELPSTNKYAAEYAKSGGGDALIIAKRQTAGRGRLNRSFSSLEGGLYMSLLIHPKLTAMECTKITPLAAVATVRAIKKLTGIEPGIKWVNDLYIGRKKLAGILTEGSITPDGKLDFSVVGIGVNIENVNFPAEVADIATSLSQHTTATPSPTELGANVAKELIDILTSDNLDIAFDEYRKLSILKGLTVKVNRYSSSYTAKVLDINKNLSLVLMLDDGNIEELSSDEVSIVL